MTKQYADNGTNEECSQEYKILLLRCMMTDFG